MGLLIQGDWNCIANPIKLKSVIKHGLNTKNISSAVPLYRITKYVFFSPVIEPKICVKDEIIKLLNMISASLLPFSVSQTGLTTQKYHSQLSHTVTHQRNISSLFLIIYNVTYYYLYLLFLCIYKYICMRVPVSELITCCLVWFLWLKCIWC